MMENKFQMFVADGGSLHIGDITKPAIMFKEITGFMSEMSYEHETRLQRENIVKSETIVKMEALTQFLKRQATSDDLIRTEKVFIPVEEEGLTEYELWYTPPYDSSPSRRPPEEVKIGVMQIMYQEPSLMRVFWQHRYIKIKFKYSITV